MLSPLLPYELNLEIWLYLSYEEAKEISLNIILSSSPEAQIFNLIHHDPTSWITRAVRELSLNPSTFWHRSVIEQSLSLPNQSAQLRYVELVSRQNVVSDSTLFLSDYELARRWGLAGDASRFSATLNHLTFEDWTRLHNDLRPANFDQKGALTPILDVLHDKEDVFDNLVEELNYYLAGYNGSQPPNVDYYFIVHYLAGLVRGRHLDKVETFLKSHPIPAKHKIHVVSYIGHEIFASNNLEMLELIARTVPALNMFPTSGFFAATNVTMYKKYLNHIGDLDDHYRIYEQELVFHFRSMTLEKLRWLKLINRPILWSRDFVKKFGKEACQSSYGLQFMEWLMGKGWTEEQIKELADGKIGVCAFKCVERWLAR